MTSAIDDKTIEALAKQIGINTKLDQLGLNLGYDFAAIDIYKANNHSGGMVTYQGTRQMLKEWRHETPQEQQRPKLRKALQDSGLVMLAEKYLEDTIGEADVAPEQTGKRESETHRDDTPSPKQEFDDMLKIVARKIRQDSEIDTLGRKLGFDPEDIYGYIATNNKTQNITRDGTLQMLRDWRKHQTKSTERSALKKALEQAGQIHLSDDIFH